MKGAALVCWILFVLTTIPLIQGIMAGGLPLGNLVGRALLPVLFLIGALHYGKKK